MSTWSTSAFLSFVVWALPLAVQAQTARLKVLAPATSITVEPDNSTSYIEVTGTNDGGGHVYTARCEPNTVICTGSQPGATHISSRLIYDNTREKLVNCNNVAPSSDGAECSLDGGILTATTHLRLGKLKLIPEPAPGYSGLRLNTIGAGVRLDFQESHEDHWDVVYSRDGQQRPAFATRPAGSYTVTADDLPSACEPTQANAGVQVTVPEGGEVELKILFRANDCTLTVERTYSEDAPAGVVETTPAGLTCDANPDGPCTGKFAYGTQLTITPAPEASGRYSFQIGDGCIPTNEPCSHRLESDRSFHVNFSAAAPEVDAGAEPDDAGSETMGDAGAGPLADAGLPDGAAGDGEPADEGAGDSADEGAGDSAGDGAADGGASDGPGGDSAGDGADDGSAEGQGDDTAAEGDDSADDGNAGPDAGSGPDAGGEASSGGDSGCSIGRAASHSRPLLPALALLLLMGGSLWRRRTRRVAERRS